jgi:energy-coupling factor transport system ATP-binding protein
VAAAALGLVGLDPDELWSRPVDELSGGQLRRVALAGLLAHMPRVLVLDEPLAGLDDASSAGLRTLLVELRAERGMTLIIVSHDLDGVRDVCDRLVHLRDGRVVSDTPMPAALEAGRP